MTSQFIDPQYAQLCSEKTLQTNKQGFFLQFADAVAEEVGEKWIRNVFGKLKTDQERIRVIYQDDKIKSLVGEFLANVRPVYRKKCPEIARQKYLEALQLQANKKILEALNLINQSVLRAPPGPILAVALQTRANLLITTHDYSRALADLQHSLKEDLPPSSKADTFLKMALCYKGLGEDAKATIALNVAQKISGGTKNLELVSPRPPIKEDMTPPIIPTISEPHAKFKHASKKITVKSSPELGKFVVANDEIITGEVLVVEEPYVGCLLPEKFGTHCHHCFTRLVAPVGCPDCVSVAFCGIKCRNFALNTYHQYECKFLDLLIGSGMSVLSHTALRIITQTNLPKILEVCKNRSELYELCSNSTKRSPGDFLQRTLMAAFLLRCLQKGGYFNNEVMMEEEEYQVGAMLLFNLQMLQFNAHEIYETICHRGGNRLKGAKPSYIGVAVYPTVALFNHDCYPSVTRYFIGKRIVIKAARPLSPSDPIAENYGPIFTWRKLTDRQRSLSARYWFNCRCLACVENWPSLNTDSGIKRVRCPNKPCQYLFTLPVSSSTPKCPHCHKKVSLDENINKLKWCEDQFEIGLKCVEDNQRERAEEVLCPAIDTFHRVSAPPHRETHLAQEILRVCWADTGNVFELL